MPFNLVWSKVTFKRVQVPSPCITNKLMMSASVQLGMVKSDIQEGAGAISMHHQQVNDVSIGGESCRLLNLPRYQHWILETQSRVLIRHRALPIVTRDLIEKNRWKLKNLRYLGIPWASWNSWAKRLSLSHASHPLGARPALMREHARATQGDVTIGSDQRVASNLGDRTEKSEKMSDEWYLNLMFEATMTGWWINPTLPPWKMMEWKSDWIIIPTIGQNIKCSKPPIRWAINLKYSKVTKPRINL